MIKNKVQRRTIETIKGTKHGKRKVVKIIASSYDEYSFIGVVQ